ncbi:MAG: RDD family protein [Caulobacterales bacterium]|nr:RDD family protein [Caulobacterales bacterium]
MSAVEIDRREGERALITPEGIDLKVRIASAGERASAFMIDAALIVACLVALTLLAAGGAILTKAKAGEFIFVVWMLGAFLLRNAWFIVFELGPYAATPGKRALGLRVAARNGGRLTAEAVFARNAMRELEVFLPISFLFSGGGEGDISSWIYLLGLTWSGVFVLFPLFNRDRLRPGDLIAGTWVVHAPRRSLLKDLIEDESDGRFIFTRPQLEAYGVKELHVLEDVLRTRERKVMTAVADRIRRKIDWTGEIDMTDEAFLSAYYAALRGRLESRLLFGKRKRDKFDQG